MIRFLGMLLGAICLTLLTQVGGVVLLMAWALAALAKRLKWRFRHLFLWFIVLYMGISLLLVPPLAQRFGRVGLPVWEENGVRPVTVLTCLLNRHYVRPAMRQAVFDVAATLASTYPDATIGYLDANFPFLDGFPLLPHLSHNDGKKLDLAFFYTKYGLPSNHKPSTSGYGFFVEPLPSDTHKTAEKCAKQGGRIYEMARFMTLGIFADGYAFDEKRTAFLLKKLVGSPKIGKILLEPHLKSRLALNYDKVRFQGCHSVRHDDHVHIQLP